MDDVHMRAEQLSKGAEVMHAVRFDDGRPRWAVPLRADLARGEQGLLERVDGVRVLAVRGDNDTQLLRQFHRRKQIFIGEVQRTLIGEKYLERRDPSLDDLAKLVADVVLE